MPLKNDNVKKDSNGNFNAPKPSEMRNSENKLFSIYVSPFQTNVTVDDIANHILLKTEIEDDRLFIVEKLIGRKSFVSFKISTFNGSIYKAILNENLWSPNQTAHPFDSQPPKQKQMQFHQKNYRNNYPVRDYTKQYDKRSTYVPPPRFSNNRQQSNNHQQQSNRSHYNGNQRQRYRDNDRQYNARGNRQYDERHYNAGGDNSGSIAGSYHRGNERSFTNTARPSSFLATDDRLDKPRTNPFRTNREDYQYRSTNSVHRM